MIETNDPLDAAEAAAERPSLGDRAAEATSVGIGSWRFILIQAFIMALWVLWNALTPRPLRYDPYPFTFLNLAMSAEAAFTGPALLIADRVAGRRQARAHAAQNARLEQIMARLERDEEREIRLLRVLREEIAKLAPATAPSPSTTPSPRQSWPAFPIPTTPWQPTWTNTANGLGGEAPRPELH